jgi:hypothetical protein
MTHIPINLSGLRESMSIEEDSEDSKKAWQSRDRGSGQEEPSGQGQPQGNNDFMNTDDSHWGDMAQQQLLVSAMNQPDVDSTFAMLKNSELTMNEDPNVLRKVASGYSDMNANNTDPNDTEYIDTNDQMAYALNAIADEMDGGSSNEQPDPVHDLPTDDGSYTKYTETVKDPLDEIISRYK